MPSSYLASRVLAKAQRQLKTMGVSFPAKKDIHEIQIPTFMDIHRAYSDACQTALDMDKNVDMTQ